MSVPVLQHALDDPVGELKDVGPKNSELLGKLGIRTMRDLLLTLPFGLETFGAAAGIAALEPNKPATVIGTVGSVGTRFAKYKRMRLTEATVTDGTGTLRVAWFNQPYVANRLHVGDRVALAGTVRPAFQGMLQMQNPHLERLTHDEADIPERVGGLMPKYHLVARLSSRMVQNWVAQVLPEADQLDDVLPPEVRSRHNLLDVAAAVRKGHKPENPDDFRDAIRRMDFAELFELQAGFAVMRARLASEPATPIPFRKEVGDAFKLQLGFELTEAQRKATRQIFHDLRGSVPMNRLLNGDVGSGKTVVAAAAAAMAHAAGMQTVVMAPTEILARQHLNKFRSYLDKAFPDLQVELLASTQTAAERKHTQLGAASGFSALVVGTHALIESEVQFANLGLVIVDEQHRFGKRQRELLRAKGRGRPHFLAMTATPIPRTLALALYGEMSMSVIDQLPPGRTPIETQVIDADQRAEAYALVRREIEKGHQAFVICPLIDESEALAARSAVKEAERLRNEVFPDLRLELIHGRLKDKDRVMERFAAGEVQVLVATAVVEVGVDVPNATVMMIEGADCFGLAQLHQFRGRVGRGPAKSYCLLLSDSSDEVERLRLMTAIDNGFQLAEEDLRLRGMGELMGQKQHGHRTDLGMRVLLTPELLSEAREEAERTLRADPTLESNPPLKMRVDEIIEAASIS